MIGEVEEDECTAGLLMTNEEAKAVQESAKAVQEVAKTTGKALEIAEKAGPFINQVFGPLVENAVGIVSDRLRYYRLVQLYRLADKTKRQLAERGVSEARPVPPKLAVPLLESATIEDDDTLHDLWACLLANFMDPNYRGSRKRSFVTILQDLEPLDAMVLNLLHQTAVQKQVDIEHTLFPRQGICNTLNISVEDCEISLLNLMRHGCVAPGVMQSEGVTIGKHPISSYKGTEQVKFTALGRDLAQACLPNPQ